jgi:peptide/nickel transport system permease protein
VLGYVVRRLAYGVLTVLGVLGLLFVLFFAVAEPDDIARRAVGDKAPPQVYAQWLAKHGYDRPLLWNPAHGPLELARYTDTLLASHYGRMLRFDFGRSDRDDSPIIARIREGAGVSLSLTVPLFALGVLIGLAAALLVAFFRNSYIDQMGVVLCVAAMSVAALLYIIGGQFLIAKLLRWFPISGFDDDPSVIARFLALPVLVGLASSLGSNVRFYRTVFLEEASRDYVRTARAKGAAETRIMVHHVLRNGLLPVLTSVVSAIPFLFTGSLLLETFFGIPGLGAITVEAIEGNDFSTLRTMVFIGSLLFILAQILTDISYTLADPRVRLG